MTRNQDEPLEAAELRRQAEEQLKRRRSESKGPRTEMETTRLVHELEVHQIELEMQNEELLQARAQSEELLARYTDLYDFAPTGYFTLARDGTIVAVNLTGVRLVGLERAQLLNQRFGFLTAEADRPAFNAFLEKTFGSRGQEVCEVSLLRTNAAPLFVRVQAVVSENQRECRAAVLDITDRHTAEVERERLIRELQTALTHVKTLRGLLPICAHCKKIRNDQGYWEQIESYIDSHSDATFSHGICAECLHKYYPGFESTAPEPGASGSST
jgi:PAS domain S-box-containing protein